MAHRYMKRCSTSQIKITRYHLTSVRLAIIQETTQNRIIRVGVGLKKLEPLCTVGGNVTQSSRYVKQYGVSIKILKLEHPYPAILLLSIYPKFIKLGSQRDIGTPTSIAPSVISKR